VPIIPEDPDKRWNFWLRVGIVVFSIWVFLIVVAQIFTGNEVKDDALLIVSVGGFLTLLLNQYHHQMNEAKKKNGHE
jgi:hypothetical protein